MLYNRKAMYMLTLALEPEVAMLAEASVERMAATRAPLVIAQSETTLVRMLRRSVAHQEQRTHLAYESLTRVSSSGRLSAFGGGFLSTAHASSKAALMSV